MRWLMVKKWQARGLLTLADKNKGQKNQRVITAVWQAPPWVKLVNFSGVHI